jgi:hypothetical protein
MSLNAPRISVPYFHETPEEARQIWIDGLRSGRYQQTRTFLMLRDDAGKIKYCCLGVACALFMERYPKVLNGSNRWLTATGFAAIQLQEHVLAPVQFELPEVVRRWLGLADTRGSLRAHRTPPGVSTIAALNDNGVDFKRLADLIAEDYLELEAPQFGAN